MNAGTESISNTCQTNALAETSYDWAVFSCLVLLLNYSLHRIYKYKSCRFITMYKTPSDTCKNGKKSSLRKGPWI